jgi:hypothetical protein
LIVPQIDLLLESCCTSVIEEQVGDIEKLIFENAFTCRMEDSSWRCPVSTLYDSQFHKPEAKWM